MCQSQEFLFNLRHHLQIDKKAVTRPALHTRRPYTENRRESTSEQMQRPQTSEPLSHHHRMLTSPFPETGPSDIMKFSAEWRNETRPNEEIEQDRKEKWNSDKWRKLSGFLIHCFAEAITGQRDRIGGRGRLVVRERKKLPTRKRWWFRVGKCFWGDAPQGFQTLCY